MIAFFDVDHTLLRGSSARHFLLGGIRRGLFPLSSLWYMPGFYLRFWLGGRGRRPPSMGRRAPPARTAQPSSSFAGTPAP